MEDLVPNYLDKIPIDPFLKKPYPYNAAYAGEDYEICIEDILGYQTCVNAPEEGKPRNLTNRR